MRVAFIGPPGSGKGTYSQLLAKRGWVHFSMGQVLRDHVKSNGKYAKRISSYTDKGHLVPESIFLPVFKSFLSKHHEKKIIFDGLPRRLNQARNMERAFGKKSFDAFIFLDVNEKELMRRLSTRRQCEHCGKVFGADSKSKKCDLDNGKLITRKDDLPAAVRTRFKVYHSETFPVLNWAAARYPVFYIHGHGAPATVFKRIAAVISLIEKGE